MATSADPILSAADLGAQMIVFSQKSWRDQAQACAVYRERHSGAHDADPKPLLTCDLACCDTKFNPARARAMAHEHIAGRLTSVKDHYELAGDYLKDAEGPEPFGSAVDLWQAIGLEKL